MIIKSVKAKAYMSLTDYNEAKARLDSKPFDADSYYNTLITKGRPRSSDAIILEDAVEIIPEPDDLPKIAEYKGDSQWEWERIHIFVKDVINYAHSIGLISDTQSFWGKWNHYLNEQMFVLKGNKWVKAHRDNTSVIAWDRSKYTVLPATATQKQQEKDRNINNLIKTFCKDNVLMLAKQDGINLKFEENNHGITGVYFADDMSFNKIVVPAIRNYINGIVNKLGAEVIFPDKIKNIHVNKDNRLFKLTDIKMKEE